MLTQRRTAGDPNPLGRTSEQFHRLYGPHIHAGGRASSATWLTYSLTHLQSTLVEVHAFRPLSEQSGFLSIWEEIITLQMNIYMNIYSSLLPKQSLAPSKRSFLLFQAVASQGLRQWSSPALPGEVKDWAMYHLPAN